MQVIQRYDHGWNQGSMSQYMHVSQPTVDAWVRRFEAEPFAGLVAKSRAPHAPARKVWLPLMVQVYHLQKAHPMPDGSASSTTRGHVVERVVF
jgi:hypothetical protein